MRNKYLNYVLLCEMINITPFSYSYWIENNEQDESIYNYLVHNIDKIKIINKQKSYEKQKTEIHSFR